MEQAFQLQGHRGARGLFPENTVEGFRRAAALGVRWFEIDVGVLRDGSVVVHHDFAPNPDVARLPGGRWLPGPAPLLRRMDLEELGDYDVGRIRPGTGYAARFPDQVAIDGARVPLLAEVLGCVAGVGWLIELKLQPDRPDWTMGAEEMAEAVLAVVDAAGVAGMVTVQSFDWRAPRHVRRVRPEMGVGWLTRAETVADAELWFGRAMGASVPRMIAEEGGGLWTPYYEELTREMVDEAHSLDVRVIPWTVNAVADMARLVSWGVDGLITDRPDLGLGF